MWYVNKIFNIFNGGENKKERHTHHWKMVTPIRIFFLQEWWHSKIVFWVIFISHLIQRKEYKELSKPDKNKMCISIFNGLFD